MDIAEIRKQITRFNTARISLGLTALLNAGTGLVSLINGEIPDAVISIIFGVVAGILFLVAQKGHAVGFLIASIIFTINVLFGILDLVFGGTFNIWIIINVYVVYIVIQGFLALRKIPKNVNILGTIKKNKRKGERDILSGGVPEADKYYLDIKSDEQESTLHKQKISDKNNINMTLDKIRRKLKMTRSYRIFIFAMAIISIIVSIYNFYFGYIFDGVFHAISAILFILPFLITRKGKAVGYIFGFLIYTVLLAESVYTIITLQTSSLIATIFRFAIIILIIICFNGKRTIPKNVDVNASFEKMKNDRRKLKFFGRIAEIIRAGFDTHVVFKSDEPDLISESFYE